MSEYQCYEFVALDRPLTAKQMAELRAISTRAQISPTRFWNEYQWGDLKADPSRLLARYFDAHLYFANWGTRRLMLRVPRAHLEERTLRPFFQGRGSARLMRSGKHVVLDLTCNAEEPEDEEASQGSLAALLPLRAELMRGDLRCAYLAWLRRVQEEDVDESTTEPPVPPGLTTLTTAQHALVEFLGIDIDLLRAAARASARPASDANAFRHWVTHLPPARKEAWLLHAAREPELPLGSALLRAFRAEQSPGKEKRRTVGELRVLARTPRSQRVPSTRPRSSRASVKR